MRIALLTDGIYPYVMGGMQRHSFYLCKYLAASGIDIDLYHFNSGKLDISRLEVFSEDEKKHIRSIIIDFPKGNGAPGHYLRSSYRYSCRIYDSMMNKPLPDLIYAKGFSGWKTVQERTAGKLKVPVGINFHGYEMFQPAPSFLIKLQQILLFRGPVSYISKHADAVFSYGGKISSLIQSIGVEPGNLIEIPTGIEEAWLPVLEPKISKPRTFIFLGRYERRKGIEELNAALKTLIAINESFEFHFVGPIPESKRINDSRIIYHGLITENEKMRELLQASDFLVCPSHSEGMPNVIMEGMASGCAVIATDVGAVSLMVSSDNGILIKAQDSEALINSLKTAIKSDDANLLTWKRNSIGKVKEKFLWRNIALTHIDNFVKLIDKKS
jgi:glycosyltransferase involved in cell wall biosynthesis